MARRRAVPRDAHPKSRTLRPRAASVGAFRRGSHAVSSSRPQAVEAPPYAELHCLSNFTFQRGASTARELFERARKVGYSALAITDECSLAGIVRAHEAAQDTGLKLIVGAEFALADGPRCVLLVEDLAGYANLCRIITHARRAAEKGEYLLLRGDLEALPRDGLRAIFLPDENRENRGQSTFSPPAQAARARRHPVAKRYSDPGFLPWLRELFPGRCHLAVELHRGADDAERLQALRELARTHGVPVVACGDAHMHVRRRKALQDVLTAIRHNTTVAEAGSRLFPNGERHLRKREALAAIYPRELMEESARIAAACTFSLRELRYEYPHELVPPGLTASAHLRQLSEDGLRWRFPAGVPGKVRAQVEHELALIAELRYESYFLTVHDIVRYARSQSILCQGRGSAANSAVCFALGITEVDPARGNLLFERFISKERNEPPDIDVDFEHERREEVIQYIYRKYGRERAALAATVICYRPKSAVRDVGKALGLSADQLEQLAGALSWWDDISDIEARLAERGFDPASRTLRQLLALSRELQDFPRHLSQHVGGFVISHHPLHQLVPVENAAMPDRTVIQWDKDDLDTLGLLKVDCLALGMLTCLHRAFDLLRQHRGVDLAPATVPPEDPATYAMIQRADTLGVFQIESRAQMAMLPRLKPATFYDLVVEVAIVRPGPIQGKMVHPYLRRRQGHEPVTYPSEALREVFGRTLGVPIFQEQVMQLAIVAAGFTPGEADKLRRSMAAWKRRGGLDPFQQRIVAGMTERGYDEAFALQVFEQIKGFGSYGFPESHAASFALIVYVSCWLKCHHPEVFACALLNSQPMGFYQPPQILADLQRHGVEVRPADVSWSGWDCSLETPRVDRAAAVRPVRRRDSAPAARSMANGEWEEQGSDGAPQAESHSPTGHPPLALRLGLRMVRGLSPDAAGRIAVARLERPFRDVQDLVERAALNRFERQRLAEAGALRSLAGHRHRAHWAVAGAETMPDVLDGARIAEQPVALAPPTAAQDTFSDYAHLGYTLGKHPMALIRAALAQRRARSAMQLGELGHGAPARTAGLVTVRQRPGTASGVTFVTLEDETGTVNVVVWLKLAAKQRRELVESTVLAVDGEMQVADGVRHLVAHRLHDWTPLLSGLDARSRDFH
jgi:error-prone DNA polymerase